MLSLDHRRAWMSPHCVVHDLRDGRYLAHDLVHNRVAVLSGSAAACVAALQRVRTGGATTLAQRVLLALNILRQACRREPFRSQPSADEDDRVTTFESLFEDDWVVAGARLRDLFLRVGSPADRGISAVAIVTKDRLPLLQRCLTSILRNRRRWSRTYRLAVLDDSADPAARGDTRQLLARLAKEFGAPIAYSDRPLKQAFVDAMATRVGVDREVLQFGFLGGPGAAPSYGANLNSFLLQAAGELALCCDDDVICRVAPAPGGSLDRLRFADDSNPTTLRFYQSRQDAFAAVGPDDEDLAAVHERALGMGLGALAGGYQPDRVTFDVTPKLTRSILCGQGSIIATWMGLAGDSAMGVPHDMLVMNEPCFDGFAAMLLESSIVPREIVKSCRETIVSSGVGFMNPVFGADHREILPPFIPEFRNCDGVFSVCAPLCVPHGYFAHLPFVVAHDPSEDRRWCRDDLWAHAGTMRINDLIIPLIQEAASTLGTVDEPEDRIVGLGLYCEMLGRQPVAVFSDMVRSQFVMLQHWRLRTLSDRLDRRGPARARLAPEIRHQIAGIKKALNDGRFAPSDLLDANRSSEEALRRMQSIVRDFGRLLVAWPTIRREGAAVWSDVIETAR